MCVCADENVWSSNFGVEGRNEKGSRDNFKMDIRRNIHIFHTQAFILQQVNSLKSDVHWKKNNASLSSNMDLKVSQWLSADQAFSYSEAEPHSVRKHTFNMRHHANKNKNKIFLLRILYFSMNFRVLRQMRKQRCQTIYDNCVISVW